MSKERKEFHISFDNKSKQIANRLTKAFKNGINKSEIQCTWPIHVADVRDIYFNNCTIGLSLEEFNKPGLTQRRLTPEAKRQIQIQKDFNYDYWQDYGGYLDSNEGMTRAFFSKEESYYYRRTISVKYTNIKKHLQILLKTYLIHNLVQLAFQF